jgi:hypothetical protein
MRQTPCRTSWEKLKIYETRNISCLLVMTNVDFGLTHQLCSFLEFSLMLNIVDGLWLRWGNIKRGMNVAAYTDGKRTMPR